MSTDHPTFASRPTTKELRDIRREAEELRAAFLRSLVRRIIAAFTHRGDAAHGGLTPAR
ncbi:RSP_7527 family protein [Azospirillum sp. sgz302134]